MQDGLICRLLGGRGGLGLGEDVEAEVAAARRVQVARQAVIDGRADYESVVSSGSVICCARVVRR